MRELDQAAMSSCLYSLSCVRDPGLMDRKLSARDSEIVRLLAPRSLTVYDNEGWKGCASVFATITLLALAKRVPDLAPHRVTRQVRLLKQQVDQRSATVSCA